MFTHSPGEPTSIVPSSPNSPGRLQVFRGFIHELVRQPHAAAGAVIVLFFVGLAIAGPAIAPYSDNDQSHPAAQAPGSGYPFGTDYLGRDVYSRIILGARGAVLTAGVGTLIAVLLGTILGLFMGYYGG